MSAVVIGKFRAIVFVLPCGVVCVGVRWRHGSAKFADVKLWFGLLFAKMVGHQNSTIEFDARVIYSNFWNLFTAL